MINMYETNELLSKIAANPIYFPKRSQVIKNKQRRKRAKKTK